jgi:serine/threonine protein kinase
MIDWEGHTKLADFGLCKLNLTREEYTHSFCGSLEYMAPEVRDSQGYNYSVDFYTMGAFLYEMIIGVPPYYNNQPLYFPEKVSKSLMELIKGLIDKDLDKRINSFSVVKSSSWLSGVSWSDIFNKRYEMPIKLSIYDSYVHDEFTKVKVDSMNLIKEEKFDRLFDMFYYNREPRKSTLFDRPTKLISPDAFKKSKSKSKSRRSNKSKEDLMAKSKTRKSTSRDRSHDRDPSKGKPKLQTQTTYVQQ